MSKLTELIQLNRDIEHNIENNLRKINPNAKGKENSCFLKMKIWPDTGVVIKDGTPAQWDIKPEEWMPSK